MIAYWLLPSLIVALVILIHERRNHHPVQMWIKEDWIMFTLAVVVWPIAIMAFMWVVVWPKMNCWFGNHHFVVAQKFSDESRRIHCLHCKNSYMQLDRNMTMVPWDRSWHEMYERFGREIKYLRDEVRWK